MQTEEGTATQEGFQFLERIAGSETGGLLGDVQRKEGEDGERVRGQVQGEVLH